MGNIQGRGGSNLYSWLAFFALLVATVAYNMIAVVEWICWLNEQRKKAPIPEGDNLIFGKLKGDNCNSSRAEERKAKEGSLRQGISTGKVGGPDLKSFSRQFPTSSEGDRDDEASEAVDSPRISKEKDTAKSEAVPESTEPMGSGQTFRPGTWQPPT